MLRLIVRRLGLGLLVAFTVMTLAFMLTRLSGDLAISIAGPQATQADARPTGSTARSPFSSSTGSAAP
jgi:ABC-type dipeptide/oligopeptide/nickel transport system permease component